MFIHLPNVNRLQGLLMPAASDVKKLQARSNCIPEHIQGTWERNATKIASYFISQAFALLLFNFSPSYR